MPKDSQVDKKDVRTAKAKGHKETIASEEGKNKNRTTKKQSAKRGEKN